MSVVSYKSEIDPSLLEVSSAVKNNEEGIWECSIKYNTRGLVISTPRIKRHEDILIFNLSHKKVFMDFIENIESCITNNLFENSKRLFNGKVFTLEKIKNSLQPSIDIDDSGFVYCKATLSPKVECFDVFGEKIDLSKSTEYITALIKVDKISFTKELFTINYVITSLKNSKVCKPDNIGFEEPENISVTHTEKQENCDNFFD